jgi:hypothetical protein
MKVSKSFLRDFAYLANYYGWTPADIEDIKAQTRADPDLAHYWTNLAAAHRAGYEQTPENGFIRLHLWCSQQGRPNPFTNDFEGRTFCAANALRETA